jgi:hypothetical protein
VKIVMFSSNQSEYPKLRELRTIAVRWLKLKDIQISIEIN